MFLFERLPVGQYVVLGGGFFASGNDDFWLGIPVLQKQEVRVVVPRHGHVTGRLGVIKKIQTDISEK